MLSAPTRRMQSGKLYPLKVEHSSQVPGFPRHHDVHRRLADDMGDVGDVLLRLNFMEWEAIACAMAIGHVGGGPADDAAPIPTPAPATPPPADPPLIPDNFTGPISDADAVRFLEQTTWGPTTRQYRTPQTGRVLRLFERTVQRVRLQTRQRLKLSGPDLSARRCGPACPDQHWRSKLQPISLHSRQLFDVPGATQFFQHRFIRTGSVAPARGFCAAPDSRGIGRK